MNSSGVDSCSNKSTISLSQAPSSIGYIFAEVILGLLIAFGNSLVLAAFRKFHELQTSMNVYVVSLALADLTIAVIVLPAHLTIFLFPGIRSNFFFCMLRLCLVVGSCGTSALTLSMIAIDRYLAIEHPLTYNTIMTTGKAKLMCAGAWLFTFSYSFAPLFGWNKWSPCKECISMFVLPNIYRTLIAVIFIACIMCVGIVNLKVFITANRVSRNIKSQTASLPRQVSVSHTTGNSYVINLRAVKTLTVMFSVFTVCMLPYISFTLWEVYTKDQTFVNNHLIGLGTIMLVFLNSAMNPVIYNQRFPEFNRAFRKLLRIKPRVESA